MHCRFSTRSRCITRVRWASTRRWSVGGPMAVDVTYSALGANRGEAVALLDLRGARLAIAEVGWSKPPGQPATAKVVLDLDNDRISRVPQIEVRAAGLDGRLSAMLGMG